MRRLVRLAVRVGRETERRRATGGRLEHGRDHVRLALRRLARFRPRRRRQVRGGQRPDGRLVALDRLHLPLAGV